MSRAYYSFGFLYNPAAQRVLLRLREDEAQLDGGMWALFGGGSEDAATGDPVVTWQREMREELSIKLGRQQVTPLSDYINAECSHRYQFFCGWPTLQRDFHLQEGKEERAPGGSASGRRCRCPTSPREPERSCSCFEKRGRVEADSEAPGA